MRFTFSFRLLIKNNKYGEIAERKKDTDQRKVKKKQFMETLSEYRSKII